MDLETRLERAFRKSEPMKRSPWGKIQEIEQITPWLTFVSTASHGGYKLNPKFNKLVPKEMRVAGGWYEEDCEWAIVFFYLHEQISKDLLPQASMPKKEDIEHTMINNYPYGYENHTGIKLIKGQSYIKDQDQLIQENRDNWKMVSATGMQNNVRIYLKKDGLEWEALISKELYNSKRNFWGTYFTQEEVNNMRKY